METAQSEFDFKAQGSDIMMDIDLEEEHGNNMGLDELNKTPENNQQDLLFIPRPHCLLDTEKGQSEASYEGLVYDQKTWLLSDNLMDVDEPAKSYVSYGTVTDVIKLLDEHPDYRKGVFCTEVKKIHCIDHGCYEEGAHYEIDPQEFNAVNGQVTLCKDRITRTQFIRKQVDRKKFRRNEVEIPLRLRGVNEGFLHIHGIIYQHEKIEIFQEYAGKSLYSLLEVKTPENRVVAENIKQPGIVLDLMRQMFSILQHLHSNRVVHRDIKLENICFNTETNKVVVIDYGSCQKFGDPIRTDGWTHEYLSPECCDTRIQKGMIDLGVESDVWAMGITLLNCLHGKNIILTKFAGMNKYNRGDKKLLITLENCLIQISMFKDKDVQENFFNPDWDSDIKLLLGHILHVDPTKRWTADGVLQYLKFIGSF